MREEVELRWIVKRGAPSLGDIHIGDNHSNLFQRLQYRTIISGNELIVGEWKDVAAEYDTPPHSRT